MRTLSARRDSRPLQTKVRDIQYTRPRFMDINKVQLLKREPSEGSSYESYRTSIIIRIRINSALNYGSILRKT